MFAEIASGHRAAADVLFLIAAVLFALGAVVDQTAAATRVRLVPVGLVLVAVAWLVL